LLRRLAAVVRVWATRRLLWVWLFAYACVMTSAFLRPASPQRTYFECASRNLPRGATEAAGPNAQNLIVSLHPNDRLSEQTVERIRKIPALERLFVGGYHDDPAAFRRLCEALPKVRVWHLELNGGRIAAVVFLLFATLTLGGAVMQQVQATFSPPQARTYPDFVAPHLMLPLALCAGGIVAAAFIARNFGVDFWAAVSVQVFGWGAWYVFDFLSVSLPRNFPPLKRLPWPQPDAPEARSPYRARWVGGAALIVSIAVLYLTFIAHPYVMESLLLGELPWLSVGFFVVGAACTAAAIVWAPRLGISLNEAGIAPILSMQDVEKRRPTPFFFASQFHRRLELLGRPKTAPKWIWRIRALRVGNPDLLVPVAFKITAPALLIAVCKPNVTFASVFLLMLVVLGGLVSMASCFSNWWQRRKAFSVQLLYPWTRRQLTLAVFVAYALDIAGIFALLFVTVIAGEVLLDWRIGFDAIQIGSLTALSVAALLLSGGVWLLTLRHRLLASFLAFLGVAILVASVLSMPILAPFVAPMWNRHFLNALIRLNVLIAFLIGLDAYRRWMRSEWGLFGP
jgi:hypothetical protein